MATAVTSQKFASRNAVTSYAHVPGGTGAVVVSEDGGTTKHYVDMRDYEGFGVEAVVVVSGSSSGITLLEILAAEDTSGTNVQVILTSGTIAQTAVGKYAYLEVQASQIKEVAASSGFNLRYVTARLTCSNSGDKCGVTFIRYTPKFSYGNLTANN